MILSKTQRDILEHTLYNCPDKLFYGDQNDVGDMETLCEFGLMRPLGKSTISSDTVYIITKKGREFLGKN